MATNGNLNHSDYSYVAPAGGDQGSTTSSTANATAANNNLSKDEVAWFFVEQYYMTLSKTPEKLHVCLDTFLPQNYYL